MKVPSNFDKIIKGKKSIKGDFEANAGDILILISINRNHCLGVQN